METMKFALGGVALAGLAACGDGVTIGTPAFQTNLDALEAQPQIAALLGDEAFNTTASFATLTTQGAATYTGPVAINLGATPLLGEDVTGNTTLNTPDLIGDANIRTTFGDEGATLEGDFTDFVGSDSTAYTGTLALTGGRINSSFDGSGGTEGIAVVSGTLTGTGEGEGLYSAGVRAQITDDGQNVLIRGSNGDGEAGRDFTFTAAGAILAAN